MTDPSPALDCLPQSPAVGRLSPAVALATAMATLPLLVLAQLIAHLRVDEFDAWLFAHIGREMARGGVLYTQLWDNKPPGIFWMNALAYWAAPETMTGIIVLCALAVLASSVVFFLLTRRLYGDTAAGLSTILAALILNQQYFHVGCNRPSTFFVLTELLAVLFYVRALTLPGSRVRRLLVCGFVAGVGLWFKQNAVAVIGAMALHQVLLRVSSRQSTVQSLRCIVPIGVGFVGALALAGVLIVCTSDLASAWHAIVTFNRLYFEPGAGSNWLPVWFGLKEQLHVLTLPLILAMATALYAPAVRMAARSNPNVSMPDNDAEGHRPPLWLAMLWLWMLLATYLALVGPHKRLHYLAVALVPLCMLSAHGLNLYLATARRTGPAPPYYLFVGLLWCGYMMIVPLKDQLHAYHMHRYQRTEINRPNSRAALARLIEDHTSPTDTIFAWGYEPEIYFRADRVSAVRYIGTEKVSQLHQAGQPLLDEIIDSLKASPPTALIISLDQVDRFMVPKPNDPLDYRDLADWIHANYDLCPDAKRENVWLRRSMVEVN